MIRKILPLILVMSLFFCACGNKPAVTTDPSTKEPVATDPSTGKPATEPGTDPQETGNGDDPFFTFPEDMQGLTLPFVEFEYDPVITPVPTDPTEPATTEPVATEPTEATPDTPTSQDGIEETLPFHPF